MKYFIYADQARAQADIDRVNTSFALDRQPGDVTERWADLQPCAEGWEFEQPPAPFDALCMPDTIG